MWNLTVPDSAARAIFAADEVIEASAIQMENEDEKGGDQPVEVEEEIEGFREFLENVRPEDFGAPGNS